MNPAQRIVQQETRILTQCLDSVVVFANAHLMQTSNNDLALIACHGQGAKFLYPDSKFGEVRQIDGQYEKFTLVERTIRQKLQEVVADILSSRPINTESLISGALSMALCYISRMKREKCSGEKIHSRILVVTGSNDSATQYMNYMNIFFTAQKMVCENFCILKLYLYLNLQFFDLCKLCYLKYAICKFYPTKSNIFYMLRILILKLKQIEKKIT